MSVAAKTAILEHLGRQQHAMVALLADLVNIDSGSYNKRGVDAVGDRLRAFLEAGAPCPLTGLYTADEEIASPSSRSIIEAEAKGARAVFNSEPGRPSGNLVSRRKGAAFIELEVTGRAAHSGAAHAQGVSAIEALARKIQRLHRLTDYDLGTTINVGLAQGGTAVNTVAARATAAIDVRFPTLNIMEKILGEVREICGIM